MTFVCHLVAVWKLKSFLTHHILLETICEVAGSFHDGPC